MKIEEIAEEIFQEIQKRIKFSGKEQSLEFIKFINGKDTSFKFMVCSDGACSMNVGNVGTASMSSDFKNLSVKSILNSLEILDEVED
jgi:hypothetical protein